jgi:hypothetical protein
MPPFCHNFQWMSIDKTVHLFRLFLTGLKFHIKTKITSSHPFHYDALMSRTSRIYRIYSTVEYGTGDKHAYYTNEISVSNSNIQLFYCKYSRLILLFWGPLMVAQWLRYCATNWKVADSIPGGVIGIFHWHNPSDRTMALGSTEPLTEMSTRSISWG